MTILGPMCAPPRPAVSAQTQRSLRPWTGISVQVLACVLLLGCAGSGGHFDGHVYSNDYTRYRVGTLAGWTRVTSTDSQLAFRRDGMGVVGVHSTCQDYDDVPARALAGHLLFGTTARQYILDEQLTVDGRGARHVLLHSELDGVEVELELFVLVRGGCVYDITHARPPGGPDGARSQFLAFVDAFAVLEP